MARPRSRTRTPWYRDPFVATVLITLCPTIGVFLATAQMNGVQDGLYAAGAAFITTITPLVGYLVAGSVPQPPPAVEPPE